MPARAESPIPTREMKLDLNCDLAEGEPLAKTRALMRSITSANVACGGHAGNLDTMEACVRLAKQFEVRVGAHPGVPANFGRGEISLSPQELQRAWANLRKSSSQAASCQAAWITLPSHRG